MSDQREIADVGKELAHDLGHGRRAAHIVVADSGQPDDMFGNRHQRTHKTGPGRLRHTIDKTLRGNLDDLRRGRVGILARGLQVKDHVVAAPERPPRCARSTGLGKERIIGQRRHRLFAQSPAPALAFHK
jgi:hypothetical protein